MTTATVTAQTTQTAETTPTILESLQTAFVDPQVVTRQREEAAHPERFDRVLHYRYGDWLGDPPAPYPHSKRTVLGRATRADGYREDLVEQNRRRNAWLENDSAQPTLPEPSTIDDFQAVPFQLLRPQASHRRVSREQATLYKATGIRAPRTRSWSRELPEGTDPSRRAQPWKRTDWEPLWGIDREDGKLYPIMSALQPERPLTRFLEGLENRLLAPENFEDPDSELLSLDLLMHRGWECHHPRSAQVDLREFERVWNAFDDRLIRSDKAADRELQLAIDAATRLRLR